MSIQTPAILSLLTSVPWWEKTVYLPIGLVAIGAYYFDVWLVHHLETKKKRKTAIA